MNRVGDFLQNFSKQFLPSKTEVFLDFGSGNAKIFLGGKEVASESSKVVVKEKTNVLTERKQKFFSGGRSGTEVKFLVQRGSITNFELARDFLNSFLKEFVKKHQVEPRFIG